ncbi:hypothetical protein TEA_007511 [Camellia sinensis var. sinensis]|uniref:Alkaline/neutral invertase n=1 Tax=Camellia sinensis var. sinensis TaxID=542762 RepID=A0A4S4DFK7_CAMSN|nr:hypothetical protein TEA_007511 [Camellia sinensis var. sinensis]
MAWFKFIQEVENCALTQHKEKKNKEGKTPAQIFTETHKDLIKDGEQWLKDTANASTIVAALIATVVFAAAITVPGGNNGDGYPVFYKRASFLIFGISDAFALFSSMTSVLLFLSILTSRYGENDFRVIIPRRLIFGLISLFLSILSTMIAFGATLYLVFGYSYKAWIIFPMLVLPGIPAILFAFLQFPLLAESVSGVTADNGNRTWYVDNAKKLGEYDIVRNFILHTLQLQSYEKTTDCHSPGQGLMPASFKVRAVPLDGDDLATEKALFYSALLCAREMLAPKDGSADLIRALNNRLVALSFHGYNLLLSGLIPNSNYSWFIKPDLLVEWTFFLTVACIKKNRPEIAAKTVEVAEKRISRDKWPEYYNTKRARFIGKQSQLFQTWSIVGYLVAKQLLDDPSAAKILSLSMSSFA